MGKTILLWLFCAFGALLIAVAFGTSVAMQMVESQRGNNLHIIPLVVIPLVGMGLIWIAVSNFRQPKS